MRPRSRIGGSVGRRLLLGVCPAAILAVAAILVALFTGGGASAGASVAAAPSFSALSSTAPSGLPLVQSHSLYKAGDPTGPTFPAAVPAGAENWPVPSSIRKLTLDVPGLSAWIARSTAGGVCVLLSDGVPVNGVSALAVGCSPPGDDSRGAAVEVTQIPGMPGKAIAAGVVPDGVVEVSERMADGSTASSTVAGDAWARVSDSTAAAGEQPTEITGG
jgi:hypothetical protein